MLLLHQVWAGIKITDYLRLESYRKGYKRGVPDIELTCTLNLFFDSAVAIELNTPDKSDTRNVNQKHYLEKVN